MRAIFASSAAAMLALAAAGSTSVKSDLFYLTPTHCTELTNLPTHQDLSGELVQNERFQGTVTLTASTSSSTSGCVLHFLVKGEVEAVGKANHRDVFSLGQELDQSLPKLFTSKVLRGSTLDVNELSLQRIQVKINESRDYSIDTRASTLDDAAAAEVTLGGQDCGKFMTKDLVNDVFPGINDVSVITDATTGLDCIVGLNIAGRAPVLRSTADMFGLLQSVDATLNQWFGESSTKHKKANSQLNNARVAFSAPRSDTGDTMQMAGGAQANMAARGERLNAPTKQITLGILMGITVLCVLLFGVAYQKKRHENSQQTRHSNASRVAQIHRVSYRMGYQRVDGADPLRDQEEEEEKEDLL